MENGDGVLLSELHPINSTMKDFQNAVSSPVAKYLHFQWKAQFESPPYLMFCFRAAKTVDYYNLISVYERKLICI